MSSPPRQSTATPAHHIIIEFFGVPRLLAGKQIAAGEGFSLGELAADLLRREPALAGRVLDAATGWPLPGYAFVVDERFTRDPHLPLREGVSVLLVASAAGG